jgi:hypothetical protein
LSSAEKEALPGKKKFWLAPATAQGRNRAVAATKGEAIEDLKKKLAKWLEAARNKTKVQDLSVRQLVILAK